jgi:hypothetical protein
VPGTTHEDVCEVTSTGTDGPDCGILAFPGQVWAIYERPLIRRPDESQLSRRIVLSTRTLGTRSARAYHGQDSWPCTVRIQLPDVVWCSVSEIVLRY